ncbi:MAG: biopolymer transporter ExbD [Bacteroidetes bacterium]|nr:MAG: biopolymer transporter ExbD [Bacteroidota bacterium]
MSKRSIPEINAGSMADIAFLLLIFFLVTTTMDRDQAYIRYIPKPILDPRPQPPVEERNLLAIKANSNNQILIRNEIVDMENISEKVLRFYQANEKKNEAFEFPFYSRTPKSVITDNIKRVEKQLKELEEQDAAEEFIVAKEQELDGWIGKRDALALYGGDVLPEISFQASIRIEVSNTTQYEVFVKIQSEIEEAISILRDKEAKRLFNTPYAVLKRKNSLDATGMDEIEKLDLLDVLYPARIIEVTPKR